MSANNHAAANLARRQQDHLSHDMPIPDLPEDHDLAAGGVSRGPAGQGKKLHH
jgi:hypothetical protein